MTELAEVALDRAVPRDLPPVVQAVAHDDVAIALAHARDRRLVVLDEEAIGRPVHVAERRALPQRAAEAHRSARAPAVAGEIETRLARDEDGEAARDHQR